MHKFTAAVFIALDSFNCRINVLDAVATQICGKL